MTESDMRKRALLYAALTVSVTFAFLVIFAQVRVAIGDKVNWDNTAAVGIATALALGLVAGVGMYIVQWERREKAISSSSWERQKRRMGTP